jgi:predicted nucleic acid-binding protein
MTSVCVDASLAAKWILPEPDRDIAQALYADWRAATLEIVGPPLLFAEVTNILRRNVVRNTITPAEALAAEAIFRWLGVRVVSPDGLYRETLILAQQFDLPAAYDMQYVAVAQMEGCELWTVDERLHRRVASELPWVRLLAEYIPRGS